MLATREDRAQRNKTNLCEGSFACQLAEANLHRASSWLSLAPPVVRAHLRPRIGASWTLRRQRIQPRRSNHRGCAAVLHVGYASRIGLAYRWGRDHGRARSRCASVRCGARGCSSRAKDVVWYRCACNQRAVNTSAGSAPQRGDDQSGGLAPAGCLAGCDTPFCADLRRFKALITSLRREVSVLGSW